MAEEDEVAVVRSGLVSQIASKQKTEVEQHVTGEPPRLDDTRTWPLPDFAFIRNERLRPIALEEYRRSLE